MKSILLSTRPKWCEKILHEIGKDENGKSIYEKQIEVRKGKPSEVPCRVLIYCTKGIELWGDGSGETWRGIGEDEDLQQVFELNPTLTQYNGKVIGEFICDKVYLIKNRGSGFYVADEEQSVTNEVARQSCLDYDDMVSYLGNKDGYGWHISDLKIYDNPRELSEFRKPCPYGDMPCGVCEYYSDYAAECQNIVTRPPQSWCYVEEL